MKIGGLSTFLRMPLAIFLMLIAAVFLTAIIATGIIERTSCRIWISAKNFARSARHGYDSLCEHAPLKGVLAVSILIALAFIAVVWHFFT